MHSFFQQLKVICHDVNTTFGSLAIFNSVNTGNERSNHPKISDFEQVGIHTNEIGGRIKAIKFRETLPKSG